jgi:hypothetical protein
MWPFADRNGNGNPEIEPLVPAENNSRVEDQDVRRKSSPEIEQQTEPRPSLRPSRSLCSLKLVPQRHGLCIPPGAAVSQSSEVCAVGEVSSPPPHQPESTEQPVPEQMVQEHEQVHEPVHESGSTNDVRDSSVIQDNTATAMAHNTESTTSIDNIRAPQSEVSDAKMDTQQSSPHVSAKEQEYGSEPVLEHTVAPDPKSPQEAESGQVPSFGTASDAKTEALPGDSPRAEAIDPSWLHPWPVSSIQTAESPVAHPPQRNASIDAPIPTIRIQQTSESEDTASPSHMIVSEQSENGPKATREPLPEPPADRPNTAALASTSSPIWFDAKNPSPKTLSTQSVPISSHVPEIEAGSAVDKDRVDSGHPGFTKLAIRKARNLAGSKFVLDIMLGRQLAEETKPRLKELAKPPIRKPKQTVSVAGPSQVDGIAELE